MTRKTYNAYCIIDSLDNAIVSLKEDAQQQAEEHFLSFTFRHNLLTSPTGTDELWYPVLNRDTLQIGTLAGLGLADPPTTTTVARCQPHKH